MKKLAGLRYLRVLGLSKSTSHWLQLIFILVLKPGGTVKRTTLYTIKGIVTKKSFIFVFRFGLWMVFFHDFPENDPFITGAVRHREIVDDQ